MQAVFFRRLSAFLLILMLAVCAACGEELPSAKPQSQTVRVLLSRLNATDRLDLTLVSPYAAETADGSPLFLRAGARLTLRLREGQIVLYCGELSLLCGGGLTLRRAGAGEKETGFRVTNFPALYQGDLSVTVSDGVLRPVLSIHVEDYLTGVVPYEMSDSFPLEALKAQAVAARTYALRRKNASADFDLWDTTADQVFFGYLPGNANAERAVRETRGVCGFWKGKLAQCYYAASNGGQTETVADVWPGRDNYGFYVSGPDPYDTENPLSPVQEYHLEKKLTKEAPLSLRKAVAEKLEKELTGLGLSAAPEAVRLDRVLAAAAESPDRRGSLRMTALRLKVRVSAREILPAQEDSFEVIEIAAPSPAPVLGEFRPVEKDFEIVLPVFPDGENIFGLNLSSGYENEIWSVRETDQDFVLEARRYGHGVGMSQRGAQWMALTYRKTYQEILSFYYPGMTLMVFPEEPAVYASSPLLSESAGAAPSPTPRPTLIPLTATPAPGQKQAEVTGIAADSSLNLRESPSLNAPVLMRLYLHQRLLVVERCPEDGWVRVAADGIEGFVMEKYLTVY